MTFKPVFVLCMVSFMIVLAVQAQTDDYDLSAPVSNKGELELVESKITHQTGDEIIYLPFINSPNDRFDVDLGDRSDVVRFYNSIYLGADVSDFGWTGNVDSCNAGDTSAAFKEGVAARINFFRAMAGIPATVILDPTLNARAQQAALMMSAEGDLSHSPGKSWTCYSDTGAQGAGQSNLYLGRSGTAAITGYIKDPGEGNGFVGHRRWILYPPTLEMGTGDIPSGGQWSANALAVFGGAKASPVPEPRDGFVAWPPPGFVPYQLVFARWSFSLQGANFSDAQVIMTIDNNDQPVIIEDIRNGFGDNTLVWRPDDMSDSAAWPQPTSSDSVIQINLSNVVVGNETKSFTYQVSVIDP